MGSFHSSCQNCTDLGLSGTSVISFSEDLLNRLTDGKIDELKALREEEKKKAEEGCSITKYPPIKLKQCDKLLEVPDEEDRKIFESLDCIDEEQTAKYNLTYEYVDKMTTQLLERVYALQYHIECPGKEIIIECYKENEKNILDCDVAVLKYMDCIDVKRWYELKKYMKCDLSKIFGEFKPDCKSCCD